MADIPVLRFPISGKEDEFFLLEVMPYGSKPLDLRLRGSEGSAVFAAKHVEWEAILTATLVDHKPAHDIEIRAEVQEDGSAVELCVRKNIQGITQRLGAIKLPENPDEEISSFTWCVSAIAARVRVEEELAAAAARTRALEASVAELRDQLRELIRAREDDEAQLLEKFRDLLNEKKVKIRQQQRLLAAADVDPAKLTRVAGADATARRWAAGASRAGKRKAASDDGDDDVDASVKMEVDSVAGADGGPQLDPEEDEPETTDAEETASEAAAREAETESDGDIDGNPPPPPPPPKQRQLQSRGKQQAAARGGSSRARTTRAATAAAPKGGGSGNKAVKKQGTASSRTKPASPRQQRGNATDSGHQEEDEEEPPPRDLPFLRGKKPAAPVPPNGDIDEKTESDDEL
ncbi:hypothetical protein DL766_009867 [Monosporascus sp. MC13-8B]|uniref:Uncharacterized protein n=1 Tax=Monosporascus cannonballus TaxID=155416 RepID=A0ABY0H790_9PEZI|nr:hypothetical protein DL763_010913 [Monosporascus cannonballus]RYO84231.1 hypothetical protein DL762_005738 [Monosporascus cannonballus]RYP13342.1 hypothetical protein DL766_009867 [Monosporascus sp. MC13-8B]